MRIFLCYASGDGVVAERIALRLIAEGHKVFYDRDVLEPGREFDQRIASELEKSDRFVFLISPDSVGEGRYTRTELGFARERWPSPAGNVLPVMVRPTAYENVPEYLKAVTVLEPEGDPAAEVAARFRSTGLGWIRSRMRSHWWKVALIGVAVWGTWRVARPLPDIVEFEVGPADILPNFPVGSTEQLTVTFRDLDGRRLERPVGWVSDAPEVASVSNAGLVAAHAPGIAQIQVLAEKGLSRLVTVQVVDSTVAIKSDTLLAIGAASSRLEPGERLRLSATVLLPSGHQITGAPIEWSTADPRVADVSPDGLVHAVGFGRTVVRASLGSYEAQATIEVAPLAVPAPNCEIPNLVGRPYDVGTVLQTLRQERLVLGAVDTVNAAGGRHFIIRQSPRAGTRVACGTEVGLVVDQR